MTLTTSFSVTLEIDKLNVIIEGVSCHGASLGIEERQHIPLFFTVAMLTLGRHVGDDTTGCRAVVTGATLRAIHIVCELTVDLGVKDLSSASVGTEDTNTIPCVDRLEVLASVDL